MSEDSAVSNAILSASYNIVLQVFVRILSSLSNAVIFRLITKEALGVINVRLLLLYSTCHCLSREAFRRSCLSKFHSKSSVEKTFNLLWMIVPACLMCSFVLRYIWIYLLEAPDPSSVPHYTTGVNVVMLSVWIEILAEPIYVFSQSCKFVKLKVVNEGLMLTIRSSCMVFCLIKWPHQPIFCFCFSQALSSLVYTASYYGYFAYYLNSAQQRKNPLLISSLSDTLPTFTERYVHWDDVCLTWSFFKQTLLKQLLTEGERYLMTFFAVITFAEQGLYDVVNNLGSLAARFIFLPIEDSAYLMFTQLLSRDKTHPQGNIALCLNILGNVIKLMILIGFILLAFGFSYSRLLLHLYGGAKLSVGLGLNLMRCHCFYAFLLAINGITEGFKFAVMNHKQIDRYNKNLVLLSAGFLFAGYILARIFGSVGFILANCLNMVFRIVHSLLFIQDYFNIQSIWWGRVMPCTEPTLLLIVSLFITSLSDNRLCCEDIRSWMVHVLLGAIFFLGYVWMLWRKERSLFEFIYEQWKKKDDVKTKVN